MYTRTAYRKVYGQWTLSGDIIKYAQKFSGSQRGGVKRVRWLKSAIFHRFSVLLSSPLLEAAIGQQAACSLLPYTLYVAAKATYIRLLHGKIGILEGFIGPSSVHRGRTHIVLG